MTTTAPKSGKDGRGRKKSKRGLALPDSTTTIEIGGAAYFVTPAADMEEWLEDMEDILDSKKAMEEPGDSIPLEKFTKDMKITLPSRRKK